MYLHNPLCTVHNFGRKSWNLEIMDGLWTLWTTRTTDGDVPSVYGTGCAKSGSTTCLPVPWRCWGPLGRSRQAVFRVPDFAKIGVGTCLATAVESARIRQTGQDVAQSPSHERCTRRTRGRWNRVTKFGLTVPPSWPPWTISCCGLSCHGRRIGQDHRGRLKPGPMALPRALCKTHPRVPKSEAQFEFSGAPKVTPSMKFRYAAMS